MGRRILQVAAGVVLGLAASVVLVASLSREQPPPDPHLLPGPWPAPRATLTDHRGRPGELPGDFDGVSVVFFGYTHCPDVCPLTLAELARVADRLPPEQARRFRTVLVTVDPTRDTPERLAEYLAGFDPSFVGLTGSAEELREVASAWGAWGERSGTGADASGSADHSEHTGTAAADAPGGEPGAEGTAYLVDHTTRAFVVDPRGRIVATFPAATPAEAMLTTVRGILEAAR